MKNTLKKKEEAELLKFGERLVEIEKERISIIAQARGIIGFDECSTEDVDGEELDDIYVADKRCVLIKYATDSRNRWKMESTQKKLKAIMRKLEVEADELDWGDE